MQNDLTMRDATLEELKSTQDYIKSISYSYPRWIPVTERLPDDNENVLIYNECDYIHIGWYSHGGAFPGWHSDGLHPSKPLAWMPLPKAYRTPHDCEHCKWSSASCDERCFSCSSGFADRWEEVEDEEE